MEELEVGKVIICKQIETSKNYEKFKKIINENQINVLEICDGKKLNIEKDLYFEVIWPDNSNFICENVLNNNSIVLKLYYNNFSILFTGDIEKIAEKAILQKYSDKLQILNSTVLKVAHHGSKTSSIQEFLKNVKPKIALIGVGENNKFGHPNDDVINRLENLRHKNI